MTNQEALNRVWQWFVVERHKPGVRPDSGYCVMYVDKLTRCAVGCLIPDSILQTMNELQRGLGFNLLQAYNDKVKEFFKSTDEALLGSLQAAHDNAARRSEYDGDAWKPPFLEGVEKNLRGVAMRWHLSIPENEDEKIVEKLLQEISQPEASRFEKDVKDSGGLVAIHNLIESNF